MRYIDKDHTAILTPEGASIPAVVGNRDYDLLIASGLAIEPWQEPVPNRADVSAERDRRIKQGVPVTISDGRTFVVETRNEKDFRNINGLVSKAILLTMAGASTTITFRDASNTDQVLTPAQMIEVGSLVGAGVDSLYKKSWAIKDNPDGIPDAYKDDAYWNEG